MRSSSTRATTHVNHQERTLIGPQTNILHPIENGQTSLFLVRHGRTAGNVARLLHGSTDLPLDQMGLQQAALIGKRLTEEANDTPFDALIASPLRRARMTAGIVSENLGLEPMFNEGLVEIDFGRLEGYTIDRIVAEHPDIASQLERRDELFGWPEGETFEGFHSRVLAVFMAILEVHHRHRVVVVAHGGVIGSFIAQTTGMPPRDWERFHTANCSLTQVTISREDTHIHLFNDSLHLDGLEESDLAPISVAPEPSHQ